MITLIFRLIVCALLWAWSYYVGITTETYPQFFCLVIIIALACSSCSVKVDGEEV